MIEPVLAAVVLALCVALLLRLLIGARRRQRFDGALRRAVQWLRRKAGALRHWRASRRAAAQAANDAIRRARGRGEWDGNVYTPKSLRKPPRDKMH